MERYSLVRKNGCVIMGNKITTSKPKQRNEGYLRLDARVTKTRKKHIHKIRGTKNAQIRVFWHHICWRRTNGYKQIPNNFIIYQHCGKLDCGARAHIGAASKSVSLDAHKQCCYVRDPKSGTTGLLCVHKRKCMPPTIAKEITTLNKKEARIIKSCPVEDDDEEDEEDEEEDDEEEDEEDEEDDEEDEEDEEENEK